MASSSSTSRICRDATRRCWQPAGRWNKPRTDLDTSLTLRGPPWSHDRISVVGTLLTDNLTDGHDVPLWISTTIFSVLLLAVFGIWWARERTLSIHTIVTTPRESFYWLTVLVTFALGTAAGDWTVELTNWGPGPSVLLPAGLITAVLVAWRLGAGPILCF